MKKIINGIELFLDIIKLIIYRCFSILPIQEKLIVFESHRGLSYSCNPKYIYEAIVGYSNRYLCVWSFQDVKTKTKDSPVKVKRFSLRYYYYLARASCWIQNGEFGKKIRRRKGTIYINTQHGTPLKKMGIDIPNVKILKRKYDKTKKWDFLISPNEYASKIFRRAYLYKGEILEIGYPRNDIFYKKNNKKDIELIKEKLKIPLNKKVILYAPTYRDNESIDVVKPKENVWDELKIDLKLLYKKLANDYVLIIRAHHLKTKKFKIEYMSEIAIDFTDPEYDIQELCLISDILITDYSSVIFDYAHLKKPMLFFTYDLNEYKNKIRGMYLDFEEIAPGPLLYTNNELIDAIININEISKEYERKVKQFYDKYCYINDGNASGRIIEKFIK